MSGGSGPVAAMPARPQCRHRRRDDARILAAHRAVLAGMGIEAGHGEARRGCRNRECSEPRCGHRVDLVGVERVDRLPQGQMHGDRNDAQVWRRPASSPAARRPPVRPGIRYGPETRIRPRRASLMDRIGHHRRRLPATSKRTASSIAAITARAFAGSRRPGSTGAPERPMQDGKRALENRHRLR